MLLERTIRQRIVTLLRLYAVILKVGSGNPGYNSNPQADPCISAPGFWAFQTPLKMEQRATQTTPQVDWSLTPEQFLTALHASQIGLLPSDTEEKKG